MHLGDRPWPPDVLDRCAVLWELCFAPASHVGASGRPAAPAKRSDVERVLSVARGERPGHPAQRLLNIVLLADAKDHGENEHDYPRRQSRWGLLLGDRTLRREMQRTCSDLIELIRPSPLVLPTCR